MAFALKAFRMTPPVIPREHVSNTIKTGFLNFNYYSKRLLGILAAA